MESNPSLMALPITGTTELIANLIERRPIASALAATAVFIYFFIKARSDFRFSSLLSPAHMPIERKQFVKGTNIFLDI